MMGRCVFQIPPLKNYAIIQTSLNNFDDIVFSYHQIDNNFIFIDFDSSIENKINLDMFDSLVS